MGGSDPQSASSIELRPIGSSDPLFPDVFALGESQKRYTGLLTGQAWREYADDGRLLVAIERAGERTAGRVVGYAAFRLPRQEVVLAHLVVDPRDRGRGIARMLVERLSAEYSGRRGIKAKCRRDYPATTVWPELGFVAQGDLPGRGADGARLTVWWRDHGHPDLMTWSGAPASLTPVVIDTNVFLDLHSDEAGEQRHLTRELLVDTLGDRLELLVTPELGNEINRNVSDRERVRLHAMRNSYPTINADRAALDSMRAAVIAELGGAPRGDRDRSDLLHVAYAAIAGVGVVVTRDDQAQRRLGAVSAATLGVAIVSPQELVAMLDEAEFAELYSPFALLRTGYYMREAGIDDRRTLIGFLDTVAGEKRGELTRRVRELAEHRPNGAHRLLFFTPRGDEIALLGTDLADDVLEFRLLRMKPFALATTMAAQLASRVRPLAEEAGVAVVRVTDPHPSALLMEALVADGFAVAPDGPVGLTLKANRKLSQVASTTRTAAASLRSSERDALTGVLQLTDAIDYESAPQIAAALERQLRPLRILDANLDSWLVPIKPPWASQLFGVPDDMYGQDDHLGLSVEHVYYRRGRSGELAPARLLWYVSGQHHRAVIGCSELVEVRDGTPKDLHRAYRRLGVYGFDEVQASADRKGQVRALRVINTELFANVVTLARLRQMAEQERHRLQLISPRRIPAGLFARIMTEARR